VWISWGVKCKYAKNNLLCSWMALPVGRKAESTAGRKTQEQMQHSEGWALTGSGHNAQEQHRQRLVVPVGIVELAEGHDADRRRVPQSACNTIVKDYRHQH
jgi:hypothetical protein